MTASDETAALVAALLPDVQAVAARLAQLKADTDALVAAAQAIVAAVEAAVRPVPTMGSLGADIQVGPAPEVA